MAYVLNGYPWLTDTYVLSEIYRVEQTGLQLRIYAVKRSRDARHPILDRIAARPEYLPSTTRLSGASTLRWLVNHLGAFLPSLVGVALRRPLGLVRAVAAAFAQTMRVRRQGGGSRPRFVYLKEFLLAVALADKVLRARDVRSMHAHYAHRATTVTWLASLVTGLPFSFTAHAKDIHLEALNPAGLLRRKLLAARFSVTCTEANRAHLASVAPAARVVRVYHGLNAEFAELLREQPPSVRSFDSVRILCVARQVRKKGIDVLVEACAELARQGVDFAARIVGEDDEEGPLLRERIAKHGLEERVALPGPMLQAELYREYCNATVFCLPCRVLPDGDRDGIPNVVAEAMASGLPVITTGVSCIAELMDDGRNGLIVPPDDPQALAAAVRRLQANPALAASLGRAAARSVRERFDGEAEARRLAALLDEPARGKA